MKSSIFTGLLIVAALPLCQGCKLGSKGTLPSDASDTSVYKETGIESNAPLQTRIGYLSVDAMQHPMWYKEQDYFDLYDKDGEWRNQIVIVFEPQLPKPEDLNRPVEIKGPVGIIDMRGPKGTKKEYSNECVVVRSWRYLDPREVPRKKEVEPSHP